MPSTKLTDRFLQTLQAPEQRTDHWDTVVPGLGIRISSQGHKVFYLRYRHGDRRRRLKLGPYPALSLAQARSQARALASELARGHDPQVVRQEQRLAETFAELAAEYLEIHAKRKKRSWREDERLIRKELLPSWGRVKAKEVTRRDVVLCLERIVERGAPIQANRVRSLISKIFNFGVTRGLVEVNPAYLLEPPAEEKSRQRVLTQREIATVWKVLENEHPIVAGVYKLRLLTAQRSIEVRSMRWQDLDGDWWTIPSEVAKNGQLHRVPISAQARQILDDLERRTGGREPGWVFASPRKPGDHVGKLQTATQRIRQACGFDFVPHDLRRTAASLMTSMGIPRLTVSKILNHTEPGVTKIYDRYSYDAEKLEALQRWGAKVEQILRSHEASPA